MNLIGAVLTGLLVLAIMVISGCIDENGSDWPMFRYDLQRTGETSDALENPEGWGLARVNRFKTGLGVYSSPAISGNFVYIGSWDNYVYCLDKNTGELKWKFKTERWVDSSPAISGNFVYIGSWDGYVYAFMYAPKTDIACTPICVPKTKMCDGDYLKTCSDDVADGKIQ